MGSFSTALIVAVGNGSENGHLMDQRLPLVGSACLYIRQITGETEDFGVDSQMKCKFCIKTEPCMEYEEWEAATVT